MATQNLEQQNVETQNQEAANPVPENPDSRNANPTNETGFASLLGDSATPNRHPLNQGQNVETQNPDSENLNPENPESSFLVLPLAITGSVILVSSIAVIAVLAKRRKGKAAKP